MRSPPQGLDGGIAATSVVLRSRRRVASWAGSPQHRSCCEVAAAGPLGRKVPRHRSRCEIAAGPFELSCRDIALAARSPLRGLLGGVAATSLFMRDYRRASSSWVELPRRRSSGEIAVAGSLRRSCRDIALAARSLPRGLLCRAVSTSLLLRGRRRGRLGRSCRGIALSARALPRGLSGQARRDLAFAARSPPRASCRSCRGIALAARSPPQGLTGVAAATSLLLRGRGSRASWAELPRHRSCCDVAAALRCVVLDLYF